MLILRTLMFLFLFPGFVFGNQGNSQDEASLLEIDKKAQFGDVRLGDSLSKRFIELTQKDRIQERRSYGSEGIKWYRLANSPTQLDGAALRYVYYGFKDERLVEIVAAFSVQNDVRENTRFFEKLEKQFSGTRVNHEMWLWSGDNVGLDFSGYCGLDTCSLSYLYIFPKSRIGKFSVNQDSGNQLGETDPSKSSK